MTPSRVFQSRSQTVLCLRRWTTVSRLTSMFYVCTTFACKPSPFICHIKLTPRRTHLPATWAPSRRITKSGDQPSKFYIHSHDVSRLGISLTLRLHDIFEHVPPQRFVFFQSMPKPPTSSPIQTENYSKAQGSYLKWK